MKAVLIGPVTPYRGGISQFHTVLANNLSERNDIHVVSFKRLYPKVLYPGKKQKEEQKTGKIKPRVDFWLDSINPVNWYRTYKKIKKEKPNWVILQWWHTFFTPCYYVIAKLLKRNTNVKISMVCHNFLPHDSNRRMNLFFLKKLAKHVDYFISLSSVVKKELEENFPDKKCGYLMEANYGENMDAAQTTISQAEAKEKLGIHGNTILFFGFVRPYKGLNYLLDALPEIKKQIPITLLIAGEFWQDKQKYLDQIDSLKIKENIQIRDQYIPNEEVPLYFKAADLLIIPYTSSTNSAVLKLAFNFNTPIIATKVGGNEDLVEDGKTGHLVESKNPKELAKAVLTFYQKKESTSFKKGMKEKQKAFAWNEEKEHIVFNVNSQ